MEGLSWVEVQEFAAVFDSPMVARRLLTAAGLGPARHPSWQASSAEDFWAEVSTVMARGVHPNLRAALLVEAARQYPGNPIFGVGAGPRPGHARLRPAWDLLPSLPPRYIPRDADLAALRTLLADPKAGQVVGVWAMGGTGKTTLATAAVHDRDIRAFFPDGIVWQHIDRKPDLVAVFGKLLAAFGDPAHVLKAVDGASRLRALLTGARALIVLDDVWDIAVVEAFDLPAGSRILVTSRTREAWYASNGGHELRVADETIARRVLAAHAGRPVDALPATADEVLARCGGLVLALAVVGSMVSLGTRWENVTERLRRTNLGKLAARFPGYRHTSLLAALDASVEALPAAEASRYRELAVFAGRGPVPTAAVTLLWERTAGLERLDAEDLVGLLAQRSLIQHDAAADTVTLHDLLFDYTHATLARPLGELHSVLAGAFVTRWGGLPDLPNLREPYDGADQYGVATLVTHLWPPAIWPPSTPFSPPNTSARPAAGKAPGTPRTRTSAAPPTTWPRSAQPGRTTAHAMSLATRPPWPASSHTPCTSARSPTLLPTSHRRS